MSWAEVSDLQDSMTDLALGKVLINCGPENAGKKALLKRYTSDYMVVDLDSQGSAEVDVTPKSRYELTNAEPDNWLSSDVFFINDGEIKTVDWHTGVQFDGATVLPINDVKTWLKCAGIWSYSLGGGYFNYTTIDQVLADAVCTTALLNNNNACLYLIRMTDSQMVEKIANNLVAAQSLGSNKFVNRLIGQNVFWSEKVYESEYVKEIFRYGTPYASREQGDLHNLAIGDMILRIHSLGGGLGTRHCTKAGVLFDGLGSSASGNAGIGDDGVSYNNRPIAAFDFEFTNPIIIKDFVFSKGSTAINGGGALTVYGSRDGEVYDDILVHDIPLSHVSIENNVTKLINNIHPYRYYRVVVTRWGFDANNSNGNYYANAHLSEISMLATIGE